MSATKPEADSVAVATSGTIDRKDRCAYCDEPLLYRVGAGRVLSSFCGGRIDCPAALMEIPDAD